MGWVVPFVNPRSQFNEQRAELMRIIEDVLARGDLIQRQDLKSFERCFADFVGLQHAVGVNSGTDAVHFALRAAGIGPGDEVITVAHTCIATVAAVVHAGARPVLVDVTDDFTIDPSAAEGTITSRTRAILPVHLNGRAADIDALSAIVHRHGLALIEDAAQAVGARWDGRCVGSFGRIGAYSLYPFKMLGALGDGGIIATNDGERAVAVRRLRDYGEDRETGEIHYFGYNSRLDNVQAAVLLWKMQHLTRWIERRREIARAYHAGLSGIEGLRLPPFDGGKRFDVFMNYTIRTRRRVELVDHLKRNGIEPLTPISFTRPLHHHAALGLSGLNLPVTERISQEFIYLPIAPELSDEQIHLVISSIQSFFGARR